MSFRDQPFAHRIGAMGDEAEGVFEAVYPEGFVRWGLNRPPINVSQLPEQMRYAPDYLTAKGLVEVQGVGSDQLLKLKVEKYEALRKWGDVMRTDLFVWDSKHRRYAWVRLDDLRALLGDLRQFPEGKPYWSIPLDALEAEWVSA